MTLREFLHIEIWSKQTTRKIWFGIGFIAIGIVIFYLCTRFWLTPMEKRAGKAALASIDALQIGSDLQFDTWYKQAEERVDTAQQESLTLRDQQISCGLSIYLSEVWLVKQKQIRRDSSDEHLRRPDLPEDPRATQLLKQIQDQLGQTLHRLLD